METNYFASKENAVFFIAEIGGNHEGDFSYAKDLANLAIKSGADAVKYQLYTGDTLVSRLESPDRNSHFKKFELSMGQYKEIAGLCEKSDKMFMASVWDAGMLKKIDPYIPIHKLGSGDLTCYPLIKLLVQIGKPIILSTGLSDLDEVKHAVDYIGSIDHSYLDDKKLALLQCTSSYPTPDEDANINAMLQLKETFGLPFGYSDHALGCMAIEVAVAMGAQIIEKHFTDTRENKSFRDHEISITCDELRALLARLKKIQLLKGSEDKHLTESERKADHHISFRRSVYAACEIKAGDVFTEDNITVLRPAHGISAIFYEGVLGKKAQRSFKAHEVLKDQDIAV